MPEGRPEHKVETFLVLPAVDMWLVVYVTRQYLNEWARHVP